MAPTVAAFGKVRLKALRNEEMPVGWMIDPAGKPLTDAKRADEGFLLPIGDYKGYGLSLVIGLLAGVLNGAAFGRDVVDFVKKPGEPTNTGQAIVAISIDAFAPVGAFKQQIDLAVRTMRDAPRLPGVERIWVPGEQSARKRDERAKHGIPMPKPLRESLDAAARSLGVAPL
jgi:LDH2 family malate/lactate/ureidoglycolate dehydrogenase